MHTTAQAPTHYMSFQLSIKLLISKYRKCDKGISKLSIKTRIQNIGLIYFFLLGQISRLWLTPSSLSTSFRVCSSRCCCWSCCCCFKGDRRTWARCRSVSRYNDGFLLQVLWLRPGHRLRAEVHPCSRKSKCFQNSPTWNVNIEKAGLPHAIYLRFFTALRMVGPCQV